MRQRDEQLQLEWLAANVRRYRTGLGLTQARLAEEVGCNPRWLQDLEAAKVDIRVQTLVRFARGLKVTPAELLAPAEFKPQRPGRPQRRAPAMKAAQRRRQE